MTTLILSRYFEKLLLNYLYLVYLFFLKSTNTIVNKIMSIKARQEEQDEELTQKKF